MADDDIEWNVIWQITVTARTPVEAAAKALAIQRDAGSIATIFEVESKDIGPITIDLDDVMNAAAEDLDPGTELDTCKHCGNEIIRFTQHDGPWHHRINGSMGWVDAPEDGAHLAEP